MQKVKGQKSKVKNKSQKSKVLFFLTLFLFGLFLLPNFSQAQEKKIIVPTTHGQIVFYNLQGDIISSFFMPAGMQVPTNIAVDDVDGDSENEIVVMPKFGGSQIVIFSENGALENTIVLNGAKRNKESHGVLKRFFVSTNVGTQNNLVLGDLNDDGKAEIIASAAQYIEIFNYKGKLLDKFIPFSKNFRGEIKIASGDIDRDRKDEIIFTSTNLSQIFIYKNKKIFSTSIDISNYKNFNIALGDLEGDGKSEFGICSFSSNGQCQISRFNHQDIIWPNNLISNSDIYLKLGDVDNDGRGEAVMAEGYSGRISIYKISSTGAVIWETIYTAQNISDADVFAPKEKIKAKVIYVDDGDTIFLDDDREIRYIGMDTPEIGEPFYLEAVNLNKELIYGREVTIEYDKQKIDPYGRYLAYVFSDERFINKELVKQGLAKLEFIYPDVKYAKKLIKAEKEAREKKRGMWK